MYQWQQMTPFGYWTTVTAPEAPDVRGGRIRKAEGQGPRVKDVVYLPDLAEKNSNT